MRNQISKRWAEEEEEEESENNKMKKILKKCSSSMIHHHQNKSSSSSSSSWSDLELDMLKEINKKLCSYADHIRFRGVCKTWRAAGLDLVRAGDVLPWLITLDVVDLHNELSYTLYEPKLNTSPSTIAAASGTINLDDYFNYDNTELSLYRYVDGWLHISLLNLDTQVSYFLFFSVTIKASFTLPQLNDSMCPSFLALSTSTPDSRDCVFLTLCLTDNYTRRISILRHGDTHWNTTEFVGGWFRIFSNIAALFYCGVFYFCNNGAIGSYDLATGALKVENFSTRLDVSHVHSFFGLDGDLILAYFRQETWNFCIRKYDWMNKVWVPLRTTLGGGPSLYLSDSSVYVDHINYYGISSANKIYVLEVRLNSHVEEYTLEDDGQLSTLRPATRLVRWSGPCCCRLAMWVCPPSPHALQRK